MASTEVFQAWIVLEDGKPAIIKKSTIWCLCIFKTAEEAVLYAQRWCGRATEPHSLEDWKAGVDIGQQDVNIVNIETIWIPWG